MDKKDRQCLTDAEKREVRDKVSNNQLRSFITLNQMSGGAMACEECVSFLKDLIKARVMRHEVN